MWSPKQRQMIDVYVSLVQRCYREHLARQAASQARLLRVDPKLLLRLHAVWLRRETKAARLMQQHWRACVVKVLPWQCLRSAPAPPHWAPSRPTGHPATASGARASRASRLQRRPCLRL